MNAKEAIDRLKPEEWAATPAIERLHLLEEVRENMPLMFSLVATRS